jgi:hypothetical protein
MEVDWWAPRMPANVLRTRPGAADFVASVDVEAALDPETVEVCVVVEGPFGVFADPEPDALLVPEPLADEPDESEEGGLAQAIPLFVKTAAPTPKATASPPIRPIYLEAFITFS